jgi:hypothetical protein
MGNPNVARRHPDYPVSIAGTFAKRIQNIEINKATPTNTTDELGNLTHAGVSQDSSTYTGTITSFPIDSTLENLFCGTSGSTVTLTMFTTSPPAEIKTPKVTYAGAMITDLEFTVRAPNGDFSQTTRIKGTGWTDATNVISAAAPSGAGSYRSKDVKVTMDATVGVRVSEITARAAIPNEELHELNNSDPVGIEFDSPNVTVDVGFWESDVLMGNIEPLITAGKDIKIEVGNPVAKTIICKNMVGGTKSSRGTVRGWATRRYSYTGAGDATTGGMSIG